MAERKITMRPEIMHFLDGHRCGSGWKKFSENPGANTEETLYINSAVASSEVTDYSPKYDFEADLMCTEASIAAVYEIAKGRRIGSEAVLDLITYDSVKNKAWKESVAVAVSSFDGEKKMAMSGSLNVQGETIEGTAVYNAETDTITFTETNSGGGT